MNFAHFWDTYAVMLLKAIAIHLGYVLVSVSVGFIIALILGVLLTRIPTISKFVLPVLSVFQTIPGIVFIGILFIYIGMVPATVLIALSIYAIFPVLKNTYAGILNVDEKYREAARGCGMSDWQILLQVEIPLAMPTIITGLRMSTVYTVSWAVLAAMIGQGGLGEFIYRGLGTNNNTLIIIGAVPAAIMAVLLGLLIDRLQKAVTPRGMRKGG
ncbi:MAG: ABC transporter permease [Oscillospiraceae bacterium]